VKLMPAMIHRGCLSKLAGCARQGCGEHGVQALPHLFGAER
jgi:hypothetical protein